MSTGRSGSSMSSRQMAYAATGGRKITFHFLDSGHTHQGYLVGMDDYHWLTASPPLEGDEVVLSMVHKGSVDLITISTESSLHSEPVHLRVAVEEIGRGFFAYCDKTFFGKTDPLPATART